MTFPILQHKFTYVGVDELSLQHKFIYIFETFIYKYKKNIYLDDLEQERLNKKYTDLLLDELKINIRKNNLRYISLNNFKLNYIDKNKGNYKCIGKNINNITKEKIKGVLYNYDSIKYIENKYKDVELKENFRIVIHNNDKNKMLSNYNSIKYIEKLYLMKQIHSFVYNFISNIIKNNNNEKELMKIVREEILFHSNNNKFIAQFIDSNSICKIKLLKKLLERQIRIQIKKNKQKIEFLKRYNIEEIFRYNFNLDKIKSLLRIKNTNIIKKKLNISMINYNNITDIKINKKNKFKYFKKNILNLRKGKNNKFIVKYQDINIYILKVNQLEFIKRCYKDIFNNNTNYNKIYLYSLFKYINKNKYVYVPLNNIWENVFKERKNNKYISKFYYKNIYLKEYKFKYIIDFYENVFKFNYKNKYLDDIWKDIWKSPKSAFINKDIKCNIAFNNVSYGFLKKDCKLSILNINSKQYSLNKYTFYIYKKYKIEFIQKISKNILKLLKQYYTIRHNNIVIKKNKNNKFIIKYPFDTYKFVVNNKNLIKIDLLYIKKFLLQKILNKQEKPIYYLKNKHKYLEKPWINIYKINSIQKYLDIQRKWWILGHDDDLIDKLIIPNIDYPYETNPVVGINKHPISSYETINYNDTNYGIKEIEVSIKIMQQMLNYLFVIWNCALIDWYNLEAKDAMPKIMDIFYYWINLDNVKEEMIQKNSREDYLRVYRWFRWEAEKVWFKTKDYIYDENNNGIKSVGMLLGNIIGYMKNHHYNIVPITSSYNLTIMGNILITFTWQLPDYFRPIDKYKGKRKYYISNKEINQIKKKLIYQNK